MVQREAQEASFLLPPDFQERLGKYLSKVWFMRLLFRHGIGWHLRTSGRRFFYDVRTRRVIEGLPRRVDVCITVPDQVLYESMVNGTITDLGITMLIPTTAQ